MREFNPESGQLIFDFPARPEFSFDNFVVSEGSRFVVEAARQMASSNEPLPPLYIYGDAHMGKTHLLIAIGNAITGRNPGKAVHYVPSETFSRRVLAGGDDAHEMVARLAKADCFLLDDVDLLGPESEPQEKLYYIYNSLVERKKTLVFSGRCAPDQLLAQKDYLSSRIRWGLTASIGPIDDATSARILNKLADDEGLVIPQKITGYLLTHVARDFTSIKDCVTRINRESYLKKKKVTLALVKDALNLA